MRRDRDAETRLGRAICKATEDKPFDYALKLRTGELIRFTGATWDGGDWVHLDLEAISEANTPYGIPIEGSPGVDLRLSDIVWAADAPDGS